MSNARDDLLEPTFPGSWNKQIAWDILFVVALPTACIVLDPVIFKSGYDSTLVRFSPLQFPAYFLIVLLMVGFWISYLPVRSPGAEGLVRGVMLLGFVVSVVFTIYLVLLAAFAFPILLAKGELAFAALTPFGLVPAFTAYRYRRRLRTFGRSLSDRRSLSLPVVAGFVIPIVLASIVHIGVARALEASIQKLYSSEPKVALAAMEELAEHSLCNTACRGQIVRLYCTGEIDLPPERFVPLFEKDSSYIAIQRGGCRVY